MIAIPNEASILTPKDSSDRYTTTYTCFADNINLAAAYLVVILGAEMDTYLGRNLRKERSMTGSLIFKGFSFCVFVVWHAYLSIPPTPVGVFILCFFHGPSCPTLIYRSCFTSRGFPCMITHIYISVIVHLLIYDQSRYAFYKEENQRKTPSYQRE
jgi:hypothetical protein